jgi:hypothetical protein
MEDQESAVERAEEAAGLALENLARLGKSCRSAHDDYFALVRERDLAIVGVARWGYPHRVLAEAAHVTPQRVTQILAEAHKAQPGRVPGGLVDRGRRSSASSISRPPRSS